MMAVMTQLVEHSEQQSFDQVLSSLELKQRLLPVLMCPEEGEGLTTVAAANAIAQYEQFLTLRFLYPNLALVPDQVSDRVKHIHILVDLHQYLDDCLKLYGYVPNHCIQSSTQVLDDTYAQTQFVWKVHYQPEDFRRSPHLRAGCIDIP
jgi:hypothetical protein